MLLNKIENARLTKGQVPIADYFSKNEDRICFMTISEIAQELGVNDTAIMRFCRTINYSGFKELQKDLQNALLESINPEREETGPVARLKAKGNEEDVTSEYFENAIKNLEQSLIKNGIEKYQEVSKCIMEASDKYIVGFRGCGPTALSFAQGLRYLVDNVIDVTNGDSDAIEKISQIIENDVCFMVSYSRYGKIDRVIAKLVKDRGAKLVVVSDKPSSPLTQDADIVLHTETESGGFFNSQVSAMFTIEAIMLNISSIIPRDELNKRLSLIDLPMKQLLY